MIAEQALLVDGGPGGSELVFFLEEVNTVLTGLLVVVLIVCGDLRRVVLQVGQ